MLQPHASISYYIQKHELLRSIFLALVCTYEDIIAVSDQNINFICLHSCTIMQYRTPNHFQLHIHVNAVILLCLCILAALRIPTD